MAEPAAASLSSVRLDECPPRGRINLRGDAADQGFVDSVAGIIGAGPPQTPNVSIASEDLNLRILWLGPDEWLVETRADDEEGVARNLEEALSGFHAAVTIVGDASVTLTVSGPRAADVLAKGMTLDLCPDVFGPGRCARSLLARTAVLLHRPGGDASYEITVARSYADYTRRWLEDAAREYRQG